MKKEKIPATVRNSVWNQNIGVTIGQSECMCCKSEPITRANFECGHVIAEKNNGIVELNNLKPICKHCNTSMGTENMDSFMKKYGFDKIGINNVDKQNDTNSFMKKYGFNKIGINNVNKQNDIDNFMKKYGFDKIEINDEHKTTKFLLYLELIQSKGKKSIKIKKIFNFFTVNKEEEGTNIYKDFLSEKITETKSPKDRIHCSKLHKLFTEWFATKNSGDKIPNNKKFIDELRKYKLIENIKINGISQLGMKNHIIKNNK